MLHNAQITTGLPISYIRKIEMTLVFKKGCCLTIQYNLICLTARLFHILDLIPCVYKTTILRVCLKTNIALTPSSAAFFIHTCSGTLTILSIHAMASTVALGC